MRRFILANGKRHPREMGAAEVTAFLTGLATEGDVAASTQNQALAALLFLYRAVPGVELPWLDEVVRAKRLRRLPVVLSRPEVQRLLAALDGTYWLMTALLYGGGLRLMECLRRRVKDVDFDRDAEEIRAPENSICASTVRQRIHSCACSKATPEGDVFLAKANVPKMSKLSEIASSRSVYDGGAGMTAARPAMVRSKARKLSDSDFARRDLIWLRTVASDTPRCRATLSALAPPASASATSASAVLKSKMSQSIVGDGDGPRCMRRIKSSTMPSTIPGLPAFAASVRGNGDIRTA